MTRFHRHVSFFALMLFTTACTQNPAQIVLRGGETFKRDAQNAQRYAALAPSTSYEPYPTAPVYADSAKVESIGVSDLTPPQKIVAPVPQSQAPQPALVKAPEQHSQDFETQKINPWTKRPREVVLNEPSEKPIVAPLTKNIQADKRDQMQTSSLMWPIGSTKVISGFGPKGAGKANDGINIASAAGEPVWASADGEIVYSGNELKGYGNMVLIKHAAGKTTSYAHLSRAAVDKYDRVKQGDIIGYVGASGNVSQPQLHFAVRDGKDAVDPQKYLSRNVAGL